ncbi:MAG: TolC family protein [Deltaproteobacteria bacterium]|nr:TolC family protein [Deltaproteobacteria bacterium]
MMAIFCFRKSFAMLLILNLLLFTLSCVTTKDVRIAEEQIPSDVYSEKDMPAAVEIKPISQQIVDLPEKGPLKITVKDAILIALENNRSLLVERINPSIRKTFEDQERAVFDPTVEAEVSDQRNDYKSLNQSGSYTGNSVNDVIQGSISLKEYFPTGTFVEIDAVTKTTDSDLYNEEYSSTRLGLSVTQSLLRGFGTDVNLARLRQSRLETDITQYELRGFSESLLAQVETTYWDYALSQRQIEIVEESLKIAKQQIADTEEMIKVGAMAEAELAAVQAEVAAQQQALINARSTMESTRLLLLRMLNPPGQTLWDRDINIVHPPTLPEIKLDEIETHVALAIRMRPEMNQAKLDVQKENLEIVRTKNGLLPQMDLFITLGKTGYADSFSGSVNDIDGDSYDILAGLNFKYPIFNRDARAQNRRAVLRRDQAEMALDNLKQLVELDVRSAYIEVNRTKEQISASTATRKFQEEKLRIETEKFRVGLSTNFFVAQAQRDLLLSRINEVQAVVNYLKALINFYRQEGSLLERRGIDAPGRDSIENSTKNK